MFTTLLLVYCTLFRVNPIPVADDRYSGCKRCEIGGLWLCMTLDMVISPVYTAALNQFKMALEPARGHTTDFSAHNFCSYHGMVCLFSLCSSTVCIRSAHSCSGHATSCPSAGIDNNSLNSTVETGPAGLAATGPICSQPTHAKLNVVWASAGCSILALRVC